MHMLQSSPDPEQSTIDVGCTWTPSKHIIPRIRTGTSELVDNKVIIFIKFLALETVLHDRSQNEGHIVRTNGVIINNIIGLELLPALIIKAPIK